METAETHVISDGAFKITVGSVPTILGYAMRGCAPLGGGAPPVVTLFDPAERRLMRSGEDFDVSYARADGPSAVRYTGEARLPLGRAAFAVGISVDDGIVTVGWECLREEGLELVGIDFPGVVSTGGDPSGRMALTARGGRLVDPAQCRPGDAEHRYNWVYDSFCGRAVLYNRDLTAVLALESLDDTLTSHVLPGEDGRNRAMLGVSFRHRYTAFDRPYRFARPGRQGGGGEEGPHPREGSFIAHGASRAHIELHRYSADNPDTGWVFGMKQVFRRLPPKRTGMYRDCFVYKIFIGAPGAPLDTTFDEALGVIRAVWERTGGVRQVCYLVGFQHEGHDSMYPDVFTVNERAGGREALLRLMRDAERLNAVVSLHDNFDDAYMDSPLWDENHIAVDQAGNLLRGGCWNGKQAYWVSLPRYAADGSKERIGRTLREYPVRDTYHLDVLTASVFRLDFRAGAPKGRDDDLQARLEVVRQFRERGIDVSSEACGLPFIGEITYFWHMPRVPKPVFEGDRRIPAVPFLVHGKADYAGGSPEGRGLLDALLYGALFSADVTARTPIKTLTDAYYMLFVPLNRLRDEEACGYEEGGGWKKVIYASGSFVRVDFEGGNCEVVIGGRAWIRNGTAFYPREDGSYTAYVAEENAFETPRFALPAGWADGPVVCRPLRGGGEAVRLEPEDGLLELPLPPGVAYAVGPGEAPAAALQT